MEEDQAICRVCRSGSSVNQPLFHPCKCSGSIRFIHQECLLQWLSHSKKKYCEVCEHPFVFTSIYRDDMPARLPLHVLLQQSFSRLATTFITLIRSVLVIIVWLVVLPTLTLWTWRFYFWSGENIGFSSATLTQNSTANQTASSSSYNDDAHYSYLLSYDWKGFLSDCFQGQIITAVVVVVFVAAYLFREWVIQNTAPAGAAALANVPEQEPPQEDNNEHLAQQQATMDDIIHAVRSVDTTDEAVLNEREQISNRLEELRREIEQRRRLAVVTDDTNTLVDNTTTNINSTAHASNTFDHQNDEIEDNSHMYLNPPSGTQSPFLSWRDYQQDNANSSLNHRNQLYNNNSSSSGGGGTWRAREFSASAMIERSDYFAEQYLDEAVLDEDNPSTPPRPATPPPPPPPPPAAPAPPAAVNNNNEQAPFDFGEDFDGILEAIGMRGNVLMLLQNSILMSLMINLCLCVTVWIPYVIGRSVILIHPLKMVGSPIYVLRWASDPLIDFGLDAVFWPTYNHLLVLCKTVLSH